LPGADVNGPNASGIVADDAVTGRIVLSAICRDFTTDSGASTDCGHWGAFATAIAGRIVLSPGSPNWLPDFGADTSRKNRETTGRMLVSR
jgi:hypothetical protein